LAEYVLQRKFLLEYLDSLLGLDESKKYQLEEAVHNIIFPVRSSSDKVTYEDHNLWVIDERLVYHEYLASDTIFSSQQGSPIQVDSKDRPDIVVFNKSFAMNEGDPPLGSVVIIEFKRPERNEYSENKNPFLQMFRYVEQIKEGKAKDRNGVTIEVPQYLPFYCYLIASMTPKVKELAKLSNLSPTPDGLGYFGYNQCGAYVEVISYKKLFSDAKKRNRAFFDKLNL
jgi:hypothetical protein